MKTKKKSVLDFDELNNLDIYFAPMQIDIGSKARRRELAEYLTDAFLFFFSAFEVHQQFNQLLQKQLYQQLLADKVSEAVTKVTGIDSYMSNHIRQMSKEVVDTTFKNATKDEVKPDDAYKSPKFNNAINPITKPQVGTQAQAQASPPYPALLTYSSAQESSDTSHIITPDDSSLLQQEPNDNYWLSYKRAEDIAKSEANTFLNYTDYVDAKESGHTKKRWLTMLDDKVRQTHSEVEGQTIGIDEVFTVGNSLMRFPHDLENAPDPKEVIGCRCAVEYIK